MANKALFFSSEQTSSMVHTVGTDDFFRNHTLMTLRQSRFWNGGLVQPSILGEIAGDRDGCDFPDGDILIANNYLVGMLCRC